MPELELGGWILVGLQTIVGLCGLYAIAKTITMPPGGHPVAPDVPKLVSGNMTVNSESKGFV